MPPVIDRRTFLARAGAGLGLLALGDLLGGLGAAEPAVISAPHHRATAKAVIWLYMHGGPSAMDSFDPKPELDRRHGQKLGSEIETFSGQAGALFRSPFAFKQHGQSGAWVSELFPRLATCVDDLAFIRSCTAESNSHGPAMYHMNTGMTRVGFPSVGAWTTYGLGSINRDLPGFIVLGPKGGPKGGPQNWGPGFLPGAHQATFVRDLGNPILNLRRMGDEDEARQRRRLDLMGTFNQEHQRRCPQDNDIDARIASMELAYRMQREAPEAFALKGESAETRALYGCDAKHADTRSFGAKCLLARRLVERGVRFVQVYSDEEWDHHSDLAGGMTARSRETDGPIAALLTDLKRRGLLDSTLVVWGGEFGRLPISQGTGRDHNPHGFLTWMAGGGVKAGVSHGETDELGLKAVRDPVTIHDLHATMLHFLGLDHERLTYLHNGRRFRLTDVAGSVIRSIVA